MSSRGLASAATASSSVMRKYSATLRTPWLCRAAVSFHSIGSSCTLAGSRCARGSVTCGRRSEAGEAAAHLGEIPKGKAGPHGCEVRPPSVSGSGGGHMPSWGPGCSQPAGHG
jgi:hypothetical protein